MSRSPENITSIDTASKAEEEKSKFEELMSIFKDRNFRYLEPMMQITDRDLDNERMKARSADMSSSEQVFRILLGLENVINKENAKHRPNQELLPSPEALETIIESFKGKVLVDIGAGENTDGYEVARLLGASGYVAVEPYFAKSLLHKLNEKFKTNEEQLPFVVVNADALEMLKHLGNNIVNIMTCATDEYIMRDKKYNAELEKKMTETLGDDGIFLKCDSVIEPKDLEEVGMIREQRQLAITFYRKPGKKIGN